MSAKYDLGWNCLQILLAASELDCLSRKVEPNSSCVGKTKEVVEILNGWDIDDAVKFRQGDVFTPLVCWDLLKARDGAQAWSSDKVSFENVAQEICKERDNLLKLAERSGGDTKHGLAFCILLHQFALANRYHAYGRRRFAAAA